MAKKKKNTTCLTELSEAASHDIVPPESSHTAPFLSNNTILQLLLIVLCVFIVDSNTLSNGFVYDDNYQILNNPWITDIKYITNIFSNDAVFMGNGQGSNYYRPVVRLIGMLNYYLFDGIHSWAFHLFNIIFHFCSAVMVFFIASFLVRHDQTKPKNAARQFLSFPLLSALVFALNPIHTSVVAWASGISELSFTLFCLISLYFYMKTHRAFDRQYILSLAFFTVAIFNKETALTLLPIVVCYDFTFRPDRSGKLEMLKGYAPYGAVLAVYFIIRIKVLGGMAPIHRHPELTAYELVINTVPLFSRYLGKLLMPINLNAIYVLHPVHSVAEFDWLFAFVAVCAFGAAGYVLFRANRIMFLGIVMIAVPLLPVLYIPGLGEDSFADRYLYFPSAGFALIAGSLVTIERMNGDALRKSLISCLAALLVVYSVGTVNRNRVWHDEQSLWTDSLQKSPDSAIVQDYMGTVLDSIGDQDGAIQAYMKAIALNPKFASAYNNLGTVYSRKGNTDNAVQAFSKALALEPKSASVHFNLGLEYDKRGNLNAAIDEYKKTIAINPYEDKVHNNLGYAFVRVGNLDAAIEEFQEALTVNASDSKAQGNLSRAIALKEQRKTGR